MNVFATLKTVFFGSKFLSSPVPIDGTPRRDLVSALNGLMPLCRTIPGVRLALDIREGQVVLALNWTPRTDGNAPTGSYHYIVSDEDGVREMADSQVLLTENGKDNLPGSMDDSRTHPTVSTEKTEKDSAHLKKDVQKKAEPISSEDTGKKAKSHTLMQEVTAFLTSRYRFRFNVLTEETEVASVEKTTFPILISALHQSGRTMDELAQHGSHRNRHRLLGQRHPTLCALAPHQRIPSLYRLF
jgi:hypothetical protein